VVSSCHFVCLFTVSYTHCTCKNSRFNKLSTSEFGNNLPVRKTNSYNTTNQLHQILKFVLGIKCYMFRTFSLSIIRSFSLYTQIDICRSDLLTYTIAVCKVKNSCWWKEELSETCRVLFQKWIWEISACGWFYFNLLTLNINYSGRTAQLTSKFAFYIFIQQI